MMTTALRTELLNGVAADLCGRAVARVDRDHIVVPTDVLLPTGASVVVLVEGGNGGGRITATDGGAALYALADAGLPYGPRVEAAARSAAKRAGLVFGDGILRTRQAEAGDAHALVALCANGARLVAEAAMQAARKVERERFRDRVVTELKRLFQDWTFRAGAELVGFSQEPLRFDWLVGLPGGRQLALDTPVPDHSSVASMIMRQLDLQARRPQHVVQAIAYDEHDDWPATTLRQMQLVGVPLVSAASLGPGLSAAINP